MRVVIAGSRSITEYEVVSEVVANSRFDITEVVSGGAAGVDTIGEAVARNTGRDLTIMPALWQRDGKRAGYLRNVRMAEYADAVIVIWDGESKGSKMMIDIAKERGLPLEVTRTGAP